MSDRLPSMPRIVAVANQKGGVGKTTTAINLSAALAERGYRVLLVDMDPQGNASTGLGIDPAQRRATSYDLMVEEIPLDELVHSTDFGSLWLIPSTVDLASADIDLVSNEKRIHLLHDALRQPAMERFSFDFVFIDCPPSLNLLTVNAMVAADSVLIPLQSEFFALEGLSQLLTTVREIRSAANPDLRVDGVVMTMVDSRNNLSQQVDQDARDTLGELVMETVIPRNVRISEAPSYGQTVLRYDSSSKGSAAYRQLAGEYLARRGLSARVKED